MHAAKGVLGMQHVALTDEQRQEAERHRHEAEEAERRAAEEQVQRMANDRREREEAAQRAHNMALHRAQQARACCTAAAAVADGATAGQGKSAVAPACAYGPDSSTAL